MAAHNKYIHIITEIHNDWCRENGYPVRPCLQGGRPQAASLKRQANITSGGKPQAPSYRPQASSHKPQAPRH